MPDKNNFRVLFSLPLLLLLAFSLYTFGSHQATGVSAAAQGANTRRPLIIAHRGGAREFTENTIGAFTRAGRIGADGIETDLQLTRDNAVVIYHDGKYGRVEGLKDPAAARDIGDMTLAEVQKLPLAPVGEDKGNQHAPILADVLRDVRTGLLNIELKSGGRFDALVEHTIQALRGFTARDRVVLEPPDLKTAQKLRDALGPHLKLHVNPGYDTSVPYEIALKNTLAFRPHSISVNWKKCSRDLIEQAHKANVEVWVWTVNDLETARAMMILGADAIKTDIPTQLLALRNQ
ncbi:MAG: glycerophosphodiester phosphodiesterase [Blastocatellia bacterium]